MKPKKMMNSTELQAGGSSRSSWIRQVFFQWMMRVKTRKELARLDARQLKDVGITLLDRDIEINKPFWKA